MISIVTTNQLQILRVACFTRTIEQLIATWNQHLYCIPSGQCTTSPIAYLPSQLCPSYIPSPQLICMHMYIHVYSTIWLYVWLGFKQTCLSVCLCLCLSLCLCLLSLSTYLPTHLPTHIHPSIPSIYIYIYSSPSLSLSICLSILCVTRCSSAHLRPCGGPAQHNIIFTRGQFWPSGIVACACLSVCPSVRPSVCAVSTCFSAR